MIPADVLVEPTGPNCRLMNFSDVKKGIRLSGGVKSSRLSLMVDERGFWGNGGYVFFDGYGLVRGS